MIKVIPYQKNKLSEKEGKEKKEELKTYLEETLENKKILNFLALLENNGLHYFSYLPLYAQEHTSRIGRTVLSLEKDGFYKEFYRFVGEGSYTPLVYQEDWQPDYNQRKKMVIDEIINDKDFSALNPKVYKRFLRQAFDEHLYNVKRYLKYRIYPDDSLIEKLFCYLWFNLFPVRNSQNRDLKNKSEGVFI